MEDIFRPSLGELFSALAWRFDFRGLEYEELVFDGGLLMVTIRKEIWRIL